MSTLVLTERPLRLWDEPGARSFREPDAPERPDRAVPPNRDPDVGTHNDPAGSEHHDPAGSTHRDPAGGAHRDPAASPPARLTLADLLGAAWEGLAARATVACPVCHGELAPHGSGGRCRSCGTTLS